MFLFFIIKHTSTFDEINTFVIYLYKQFADHLTLAKRRYFTYIAYVMTHFVEHKQKVNFIINDSLHETT